MTVTKTRRQLGRLLLPAVALVVIAVLWFLPGSKMETATRIVKEIRTFQTAHNKLPDSLSEIGEKDDTSAPVHYQKLDERSFRVWSEANSDEREVYDSVADTWYREP